MKEYNVVCCYLDKTVMQLHVDGIIVHAKDSEEAKKKALEALTKSGKDATVLNVYENSKADDSVIEKIFWEAKHLYDTYEKKVVRGRELVNRIMPHFAFDNQQLLAFMWALRGYYYHLSKLDSVIAYEEYAFFFDIIGTPITVKDYKEFLQKEKENKAEAANFVEVGKNFIENVLNAGYIDVETKLDILQLSALYLTLDGEVSEEEKQYFYNLYGMVVNTK